MIANNKPQRVEVANEIKTVVDTTTPLNVNPTAAFVSTVGSIKEVNTAPLNSNTWCFVKPNSGYYNVWVQFAIAVDSNTSATLVLPLNSFYCNMSATQILNLESSFHALSSMFPGGTQIKVFYQNYGNNMEVTSVAYTVTSNP